MAKQKFKVTNWRNYNKALINCGSVTFWLDDEAITDRRGCLKVGSYRSYRSLPLLVWKLGRLGRDLRHLINTVHDLTGRGIGLRSRRDYRHYDRCR